MGEGEGLGGGGGGEGRDCTDPPSSRMPQYM